MSAIHAYLKQLDGAWEHRWESLSSVLEGVTEEEATWQAPCYADVEPEEGWPAPGTIAWHVAHLAHYKRHYTTIVRARGKEPAGDPSPRTPTDDFAAELDGLAAAHEAQRAAIAGCHDEELRIRIPGERDFGDFLAATIRHDAWHASQIAVVRRLWRHRLRC